VGIFDQHGDIGGVVCPEARPRRLAGVPPLVSEHMWATTTSTVRLEKVKVTSFFSFTEFLGRVPVRTVRWPHRAASSTQVAPLNAQPWNGLTAFSTASLRALRRKFTLPLRVRTSCSSSVPERRSRWRRKTGDTFTNQDFDGKTADEVTWASTSAPTTRPSRRRVQECPPDPACKNHLCSLPRLHRSQIELRM